MLAGFKNGVRFLREIRTARGLPKTLAGFNKWGVVFEGNLNRRRLAQDIGKVFKMWGVTFFREIRTAGGLPKTLTGSKNGD